MNGLMNLTMTDDFITSRNASSIGASSDGIPGNVVDEKSVESSFLSTLKSNPMFSAGFGLIGVGAMAQAFKACFLKLSVLLNRRLVASLEIPSTDLSYNWMLQYVSNTGIRFSHHVGVKTTFRKSNEYVSDSHAYTRFDFVPSTGRHIIKFGSSFFLINRERASTMINIKDGHPWEKLLIQTFWWNKNLFTDLLLQARNAALTLEQYKTVIYSTVGQEWRPIGSPKQVRPFQSVLLAENVAETVYNDVIEFLQSSIWYLEKGIPYRRGYLLHGPPGCGKSSYVMALAGRLQYNICVINISDPFLTDDRLLYLFMTTPPRSILLLEDIDCTDAASAHSENNTKYSRRVTFSGLLNALDGVAATEERVIFMTTNRVENLPVALIRPGRVDLKIRIGLATSTQIEKMFLRFFPGQLELAGAFIREFDNMPISMAELQSFFLFCKSSPQNAVEMAREWRLETQKHMTSNPDLREPVLVNH